MVRQTSVDAYNYIKSNNVISLKRWRVYDIVYRNGPLIGEEVSSIYKANYPAAQQSETIRNRITELRNLGFLQAVGTRVSEFTNRTSTLWDVTDRSEPSGDVKRKRFCPHCAKQL